jgi:hypothetical protein
MLLRLREILFSVDIVEIKKVPTDVFLVHNTKRNIIRQIIRN